MGSDSLLQRKIMAFEFGDYYKMGIPLRATIVRSVCGSTPEQDDVFEQKVRLVSPFAVATEVLGKVLRH